MTEQDSQKDLAALLPSDILSEMEMETEESQGYEDNEDEIVDVSFRRANFIGYSVQTKARSRTKGS